MAAAPNGCLLVWDKTSVPDGLSDGLIECSSPYHKLATEPYSLSYKKETHPESQKATPARVKLLYDPGQTTLACDFRIPGTILFGNVKMKAGKQPRYILPSILSEVMIDKKIERSSVLNMSTAYLIHMPSLVHDNFEGAWKEFEKIKEDGLARNIEASIFNSNSSRLLQAVMKIAEIQLFVDQSLLEYSEKHGIITEGYIGLAIPEQPERPITKLPGGPVDAPVQAAARRLDMTPAHVVLAWSKGQAQRRNDSRSTLPLPIFRRLTKDELATIDVPFGLSLSRNTLRCMAAFAGAYAMYTFVKTTNNFLHFIFPLDDRLCASESPQLKAAYSSVGAGVRRAISRSAMITKRKSASEPSDTDDHMLACRHDASRSPINLDHAVS
ncbi:hypothetical protein FPV67DRAFT_1451710 [Lyophyllum atratum]|nr:hypothetical protein FPV67DRAFT_1451710 [Lyophyllum atratum]